LNGRIVDNVKKVVVVCLIYNSLLADELSKTTKLSVQDDQSSGRESFSMHPEQMKLGT
jgi:hypothetical protein